MRTKSSVIGWPRGHGVLAVACCKPGLVQAEYLHPSCSPERYNSETGSTGMDQAVYTTFARNWKTPLDWKIITGSRRKQLRTESRNTQLTSAARLSAISACVISLLAPIRAKAQLPGQNRPAPRRDSVQHVLLLSIDGMHSIDLANLVKDRPDSALAKLSRHAVTYSNASTSFPSNSWPGLLSMVTGGSPNVTGVIFENSFDRSLSAPASDCSKIGTTVIFDSSIDKNRDAVDGGGGIDPDKLPKDPKKGCTPVFPHNFIRVNTIFEVIRRSGGRTAWSDKHPAYDFVNGPSGTGVDDLFTPEVRSFRGLKNTELYDDLKVAAILNEINGRDHTGTREVGVPRIFGMNFQAISVAQKTAGGGYVDGSGRMSASLESALAHTDESLEKIMSKVETCLTQRSLSSLLSMVTPRLILRSQACQPGTHSENRDFRPRKVVGRFGAGRKCRLTCGCRIRTEPLMLSMRCEKSRKRWTFRKFTPVNH